MLNKIQLDVIHYLRTHKDAYCCKKDQHFISTGKHLKAYQGASVVHIQAQFPKYINRVPRLLSDLQVDGTLGWCGDDVGRYEIL